MYLHYYVNWNIKIPFRFQSWIDTRVRWGSWRHVSSSFPFHWAASRRCPSRRYKFCSSASSSLFPSSPCWKDPRGRYTSPASPCSLCTWSYKKIPWSLGKPCWPRLTLCLLISDWFIVGRARTLGITWVYCIKLLLNSILKLLPNNHSLRFSAIS